MYDDYELKPLHKILLRSRAYVEVIINKLNGCILCFKIKAYWENILLFGIKSEKILKNNLIANLSIIAFFKNQNKVLW